MSERTIGPAELRALSRQTNRAAGARLIAVFLLIAGLGVATWMAAVSQGVLVAAPLMLCLSIVIACLFMVVHETAHKTAFRARKVNVVVGHICGFVIALPFEYYSVFHWDHHRFTQDPAKDPELVVAPRTNTVLLRTLAFSGLPQLVSRVALLLRHATGIVTAPWVPHDKRPTVVREARAYIALYLVLMSLSLAVSTSVLLWTWVLPLLIGQFFLRPYLYTEHTGCGRSRSAFENTRTTYTTGLVRWITWNMPFHVEHHAYPSVPFHALPKLNALLRHKIAHEGHGYRQVVPTVWAWHRP